MKRKRLDWLHYFIIGLLLIGIPLGFFGGGYTLSKIYNAKKIEKEGVLAIAKIVKCTPDYETRSGYNSRIKSSAGRKRTVKVYHLELQIPLNGEIKDVAMPDAIGDDVSNIIKSAFEGTKPVEKPEATEFATGKIKVSKLELKGFGKRIKYLKEDPTQFRLVDKKGNLIKLPFGGYWLPIVSLLIGILSAYEAVKYFKKETTLSKTKVNYIDTNKKKDPIQKIKNKPTKPLKRTTTTMDFSSIEYPYLQAIREGCGPQTEELAGNVDVDKRPFIIAYYHHTKDWDEKCAVVDILRFDEGGKVKQMMQDFLRAPVAYNAKGDYFTFAKANALGFFGDQYLDNIELYMDSVDDLQKDIDDYLSRHNLSHYIV